MSGEDLGAEISFIHKEIAELTLAIQKDVNKSLCKFYQGSYSWSPFIQSYTDCVEYWQRIVCQKSCVSTSRNIIKRLAIKIGDYLGPFVTRKEAVEKLKIPYKEFKNAKSIAFEQRKEFIDEYIARRAKDHNASPEIMKKLLQREGKQKELGQISKAICKHNTRDPILKFTVKCINTVVTTILETHKEQLSEQPPCYIILDTVLIIK